MPRLSASRNPKLTRHTGTSQGRVRIGGKSHYLGVWPAESKVPPPKVLEAYNRLISRWIQSGRQIVDPLPQPADAEALTVDEISFRYLAHADAYYLDANGKPTNEPGNIELSLRELTAIFGTTPAKDFGAKSLKLVRSEMIRNGLCRRIVNQRCHRLKRMFRWAVGEELLPAAVHHALSAVESLKPGRCEAPDHPPITPVDRGDVDKTLPHLPPAIAAMVQLQLLCGCRPGEIVQLRTMDIDQSGDVWTYRPAKHKNVWRGRDRLIYFGPRSQAVIKDYLRPEEPAAYLFSPRRSMEAMRKAQRENRKSKVPPSQQNRRAKRPKKLPGERYTSRSYAKAVGKACKKAGVEPWCPLQLRHTAATDSRKHAGLDATQALLGHANVSISQVYAERVESAGRAIAEKMG